MTSYRFSIGPKERKVGRFLGKVRRELQKAFAEERTARGLSQADIARELGVGRSVIHRQLMGTENLTIRRVGEFAHALGRDIDFGLVKPTERAGSNASAETLSALPSTTLAAQPQKPISNTAPALSSTTRTVLSTAA